MNIILYQISYLIIAVGCLIFVIFLAQRRRKMMINYKAHAIFLLMNLSISSWAIGRYFLLILNDIDIALFWAKILTLCHVLVYTFFIHFLFLFLGIIKKRRWVLYFIYSATALMVLLLISDLILGTKLIIAGVEPKLFFLWQESIGPFHPIYLVYAIFIPVYGIVEIIVYNAKFRKLKTMQMLLLLFSIGIGFLGGGTTLLLSYNIAIPPFGIPLVILQLLTTIYYTARYQLSSLKIIASSIYVNVLVFSFVYIFFHFCSYIAIHYLGGVYSGMGITLVAGVSLVFAVSLGLVINYAQKSSEVIFFKNFNPKKIIKELISDLNKSIKLKSVFKTLRQNFKKILAVDQFHVFIFTDNIKGNARIELAPENSFNPIDIDFNNPSFKEALNEGRIILQKRMIDIDEDIFYKIEEHNIQVIAPLSAGYDVFGVVFLGGKISQKEYTGEDLEFLEIIVNQASFVIEKSLFYQEISNANKKLKKEVKEQRENLKKQAEHLKKILVMRSEFLDIASHQLRTPVTVIKGALSMLLDQTIKGRKEEKKFLEACFEKSVKLTDIIEDILRASKMETEKLTLQLEAIDIKELLQRIYRNKKNQAEERNLKMKLDIPKNKIAKVLSDKRYLEEAINNLVNNSLQYTKKGVITVSLEEDWDKKQVVVRVIDTGIGIPKKEQSKLFKKFARAKNADEAFTDGSGLGLFIVRQVADSQKGFEAYIEKSEVGEGTTMVLKIPMIS